MWQVRKSKAAATDAEQQTTIEQQRLMMLNMDPPTHTRYRLLINKGFRVRPTEALRLYKEYAREAMHSMKSELQSAKAIAIHRGAMYLATVTEIWTAAGAPAGVFQTLRLGSSRIGDLIDDPRVAARCRQGEGVGVSHDRQTG